MDRALIERMLGAAVLVFLLVVIAPALLDGEIKDSANKPGEGKPGSTRTQVIILGRPATSEPDTARARVPWRSVRPLPRSCR